MKYTMTDLNGKPHSFAWDMDKLQSPGLELNQGPNILAQALFSSYCEQLWYNGHVSWWWQLNEQQRAHTSVTYDLTVSALWTRKNLQFHSHLPFFFFLHFPCLSIEHEVLTKWSTTIQCNTLQMTHRGFPSNTVRIFCCLKHNMNNYATLKV